MLAGSVQRALRRHCPRISRRFAFGRRLRAMAPCNAPGRGDEYLKRQCAISSSLPPILCQLVAKFLKGVKVPPTNHCGIPKNAWIQRTGTDPPTLIWIPLSPVGSALCSDLDTKTLLGAPSSDDRSEPCLGDSGEAKRNQNLKFVEDQRVTKVVGDDACRVLPQDSMYPIV